MKLDKHIKLDVFKNPYGKTMFGVSFNTDPNSRDDYRGWDVKKAKKVAKMFRKLAKRLEAL